MVTNYFCLVFTSTIFLANHAYADLAFLKERCLVPFSSQASDLPISDLDEMSFQGAIFYQDPNTSTVLSGDLGRDWLRSCHVGWSLKEEAATTILRWQSIMEQLGMTAPQGCVETVAGDIRVFAASEQANAQGFYVLGQLEITDDETKAWAQISEQDSPYPLRLECPGAF